MKAKQETLKLIFLPISPNRVHGVLALADCLLGQNAPTPQIDGMRDSPRFNLQIAIAEHFGCSVQAECLPRPGQDIGANGYTVIGCAFVPA